MSPRPEICNDQNQTESDIDWGLENREFIRQYFHCIPPFSMHTVDLIIKKIKNNSNNDVGVKTIIINICCKTYEKFENGVKLGHTYSVKDEKIEQIVCIACWEVTGGGYRLKGGQLWDRLKKKKLN